MYTCFDDVTLDLIPSDAQVVLAYADGPFKNVPEARERFPHAHVLEISTGSGMACRGYDVERYDYTPADVVGLFHKAVEAGIHLPFFYASEDNGMDEVEYNLLKVAARDEFLLLSAEYTGVPHIPAGRDGCQWTDRALGRSLDESLLSHLFIPAARQVPTINIAHRRTWAPELGVFIEG